MSGSGVAKGISQFCRSEEYHNSVALRHLTSCPGTHRGLVNVGAGQQVDSADGVGRGDGVVAGVVVRGECVLVRGECVVESSVAGILLVIAAVRHGLEAQQRCTRGEVRGS